MSTFTDYYYELLRSVASFVQRYTVQYCYVYYDKLSSMINVIKGREDVSLPQILIDTFTSDFLACWGKGRSHYRISERGTVNNRS